MSHSSDRRRADRRPVSGLELSLSLRDGVPSLRPLIDGQDFLAGYTNSTGRDPDALVPPLSTVLLPTRVGKSVFIGSCLCGELGCGALEMLVRRDQDTVVWGSVSDSRCETLSRSYRFGLRQYLDAVDLASLDRPGEGRGRAVARMVKLLLGQYDGRYDTLTQFQAAKVDWISAWPWGSDVVKVSLSDHGRQQMLDFAPNSGESDEELAARIVADLNARRMPKP